MCHQALTPLWKEVIKSQLILRFNFSVLEPSETSALTLRQAALVDSVAGPVGCSCCSLLLQVQIQESPWWWRYEALWTSTLLSLLWSALWMVTLLVSFFHRNHGHRNREVSLVFYPYWLIEQNSSLCLQLIVRAGYLAKAVVPWLNALRARLVTRQSGVRSLSRPSATFAKIFHSFLPQRLLPEPAWKHQRWRDAPRGKVFGRRWKWWAISIAICPGFTDFWGEC